MGAIGVCIKDPIDEYTKLLLHFDENPFIDSGPSSHNITNNGVTRSDVQSKFGGYSGYFYGDYLSAPNSNDWAFGTGKFTIDFWLYTTSLPTSGYYSILVSHASDTLSFDRGFWIFLNGSCSGYIWFSYSLDVSVGTRKDINFGVAPPINS